MPGPDAHPSHRFGERVRSSAWVATQRPARVPESGTGAAFQFWDGFRQTEGVGSAGESWHAPAVRVLVGDDDPDVLLALELLLSRAGMSIGLARSPSEVLALMAASAAAPFDVVLLDLNYERDTTSGQEGFSLLTSLRASHPAVAVVVMTGWASIEGAVEAMRRGAVDYVQKPWKNDALVATLRGALPGAGVSAPASERLGGESSAMRALHAMLEQVAFSDVPVLITGEHGTGKERIARALHEKSGRKGRFVAIHAGAVADGTFESELFGHLRGAFTDAKAAREGAFERAAGGTLFLDEIGTMPERQQAKLLRVLQENVYQPLGAAAPRPSTARIVSATNASADELTRRADFRDDLLYRLNTIHLHVPPLRQRVEEIPSLVRYFVEREATRHGLVVPTLTADVIRRLSAHPWPGNVRELEHTLQRAVLLSMRSGTLSVEHLGLAERAQAAPVDPLPSSGPQTLRDAEEQAILRALQRFPTDRRAAAESLGLSRSAFYRRLSQYGIKLPK
jgi:DNA-binding NtrC family response regulator